MATKAGKTSRTYPEATAAKGRRTVPLVLPAGWKPLDDYDPTLSSSVTLREFRVYPGCDCHKCAAAAAG